MAIRFGFVATRPEAGCVGQDGQFRFREAGRLKNVEHFRQGRLAADLDIRQNEICDLDLEDYH